jgi:hypothetical protein
MTREYLALRDRADACTLAALRTLMPQQANLLGHVESKELGFLAARFDPGQRSVVYLKGPRTLLIFDFGKVEIPEVESVDVVTLSPQLTALTPAGGARPKLWEEVDLLGAEMGDTLVWFHRNRNSIASAVSFLLPKGPEAQLLVTGLAPGAWDIWHDGWLDEGPLRVQPEAGAALWTSARGSYFLRRQSAQ